MKIKPLNWTEYPNTHSPDTFGHFWDADTVLCRYTIEEESASDGPRYTLSIGHALLSVHDSADGAKVAAQADFDQRVLFVLEPVEAHKAATGKHSDDCGCGYCT